MKKLFCTKCGNKEEFYKTIKIRGEYIEIYDNEGETDDEYDPYSADATNYVEPKHFKCLLCDSTVRLK
jgi:hypothetical protein